MKNKTLKIVVLIVALGVCGYLLFLLNKPEPQPIYTEGPALHDGYGKYYMGRQISAVISGHGAIKWLERVNRHESEKPQIVIDAMELDEDTVVADIGAGSGYFTFRIAPLIPKGKIYAVEIGGEMLEYLENKKQELNLDNVIVQKGLIDDTMLPKNSIDIAFMVDSYHEFSHPKEMMDSIIEALKPDGKVLFVEYKGEDPDIQIKPLHKMTVKQLEKEMNAVGLKLIKTNYDLPIQHITIFTKK